MAQQIISQGKPPVVWSTVDEAFQKINANFTELYLSVGGSGVDLSNIAADLVPDVSNFRDLGKPNRRWKDLYLSGNSLYLGNGLITANQSGAVNLPAGSKVNNVLIKDPANVNFGRITSPGQSDVIANSESGTLNIVGSDISITTNPTTNTVTISNSGVISVSANPGIGVSSSTGSVTISNSGVISALAGNGISLSGTTGNVTITNSGITNLLTDPGSGVSLSVVSPGVINISNSAPNIIQPVHRFIAVTGQVTLDAAGPNSTLRFAGDENIVLTTDPVSNTVNINLSNILDIKGSVFADDSTLLVDGVNGVIVAPVFANVTGDLTGNVSGNVTGDLTGNVSGNVTGNLTGNVNGNVTGNLTGNVNGNVTGDLTGNVNGNVTGDLTGSVFADDSTLLIDGVNGKIVGPISSFDGTNSITMDSIQGLLLGSTGLIDIQGAAGAQIGIGAGTSGDIFIGNGSNSTIINGTLKTSTITSDDSSQISIVPQTRFSSNVLIDGDLVLNGDNRIQASTKITVVPTLSAENSGSILNITGIPAGEGSSGVVISSPSEFIQVGTWVMFSDGGLFSIPLSDPPDNPQIGRIYIADGVGWDPQSFANGSPYPLFYDGSDFLPMVPAPSP
jgi:hypothetical protein